MHTRFVRRFWIHTHKPAVREIPAFWRRMRDLSSPSWVIPRFLGKRFIRDTLSIQDD